MGLVPSPDHTPSRRVVEPFRGIPPPHFIIGLLTITLHESCISLRKCYLRPQSKCYPSARSFSEGEWIPARTRAPMPLGPVPQPAPLIFIPECAGTNRHGRFL